MKLTEFTKLVKEWNYEKNSEDINQLTHGSHKKVWWKCLDDDKHPTYLAVIKDKTIKDSRCPYCSRYKATLQNSILSTHPELCKEWHADNLLGPEHYLSGSHNKVKWQCPKEPKHSYFATIKNRSMNETECPYCSGNQPHLTNSLGSLYPEVAKFWHTNKNKITAFEIQAHSNKKAWWTCNNNAEHEYQMVINDRLHLNCPICSNFQVDKSNCLAVAYPDLLKEWDYEKNEIEPSKIYYGSNKYTWWICGKNKEHKWKVKLFRRTKNGRSCPICVKDNQSSFIENQYFNLLNLNIQRNFRIKRYHVDGFHQLSCTVFEFHGSYWHGDPAMADKVKDLKLHSKNYKITKIKEQNLLDLGLSLIIIWELEWNKICKNSKALSSLIPFIQNQLVMNEKSNQTL